MLPRQWILPSALIVVAACGSSMEQHASVRQLHLADSALVVIPDAAPDGRYAMNVMRSATRMRDGTIAIWAGPELFLFDSAGDFLRGVGRRGDGPGEFHFIYGADECASGKLAAWDGNARRLTVISTSDGATESRDEPGADQLSMYAGCWDDAAVLIAGPFNLGSTELTQEPVHLLRIAVSSGVAETLATVSGVRHVGPLQRFSSFPVAAAGSGVIALGDNGTGRIVRWRAGGVDTIWAQLPRSPATAAAADSVRTWWHMHSGMGGTEGPPEVQRMIDEAWAKLPAPDSLPRFTSMLVDDSATIWLSDYVGYPRPQDVRPNRWTAISDAGVPTRTLILPPDFTLSEIHGDRALGVRERGDGSLAVEVRQIEGP